MSETTPTRTPTRAEVKRVLEDTFWPFLAHDPADPERFWGQATDAVLDLLKGHDRGFHLGWRHVARPAEHKQT